MRFLTTAANGPEAEMLCALLREARIDAVPKGNAMSARDPRIGRQDIYVEDADLDRAREVLKDQEGMSEEELVHAEEEDAAARRLAQSSHPEPARKTRLAQAKGIEHDGVRHELTGTPTRKRSLWDKILRRSARTDAFGNRAARWVMSVEVV